MSGCAGRNGWFQATQAFQGAQNVGADEFCGLGRFQKNNSFTFKGRYDPKGAQPWIQEVEEIFKGNHMHVWIEGIIKNSYASWIGWVLVG